MLKRPNRILTLTLRQRLLLRLLSILVLLVVMGAVELTPPLPQRAPPIATLAARAKRHAKRAGMGLHVFARAATSIA